MSATIVRTYRGVRLAPQKLAALFVLAGLTLGGCSTGEWARSEGMSMVADGKYDTGLARLAEATRLDPTNAEIRKDYLYQRTLVIERLLTDAAAQRRANRPEFADAIYRRVNELDPGNSAARQGLAELEAAKRHDRLLQEADAAARKGDRAGAATPLRVLDVEKPGDPEVARVRKAMDEGVLKDRLAGPTLNIKGRKPLTLQFRDANLKMIFEAIARTTGVNILLDKEVKSDIKATLFVKDSPVEEAIDLLLIQNQLEKRVLGENSVLIYPATPAKAKDYQDLKVRHFALGNADPKQVQSMLKTIVKTKDIFVDEKTSSVIIRDTPDVIRLAEKLVAALDQAEPEVMLEIDVMQVDRNRMLSLGIDWTKSFTWSLRDKMTLADFKARTLADVNIPGFSVTANAQKIDGDVNDLATPRIRVRNKEKAKILVGTRNPVVSSAATPAPSGGGQTVYNTAVQYIETGIKVEVEPHIHPNGDVAIKLALEVSSAGAQINTGDNGTVVFPINTNNVTTVLQLKDGETQILGGLIQHQSDQSQNKIPGFGDIPLLGRLFGTQKDTWNKKELILTITPHVLRNIAVRDADSVELWSGTEGRVRYGPPNFKLAGGSGVVGSAGGGSGGGTPSPSAMAVPVGAPAVAAPPSRVTPPPPPPPSSATAMLSGPQEAKPGEKISVSLELQGGSAVTGVSGTILYDPALLKPVGVSEGDVFARNGARARFEGPVREGAASLPFEFTAEEGIAAADGGTVLTISFEVVGSGTTSVSVEGLGVSAAGNQVAIRTPAAHGVSIR